MGADVRKKEVVLRSNKTNEQKAKNRTNIKIGKKKISRIPKDCLLYYGKIFNNMDIQATDFIKFQFLEKLCF